MNEVNKRFARYQSPELEILEVETEQGIALSGEVYSPDYERDGGF